MHFEVHYDFLNTYMYIVRTTVVHVHAYTCTTIDVHINQVHVHVHVLDYGM